MIKAFFATVFMVQFMFLTLSYAHPPGELDAGDDMTQDGSRPFLPNKINLLLCKMRLLAE